MLTISSKIYRCKSIATKAMVFSLFKKFTFLDVYQSKEGEKLLSFGQNWPSFILLLSLSLVTQAGTAGTRAMTVPKKRTAGTR